MSSWTEVCRLEDITPGTGVCALLGNEQVAVFRPWPDERLFAISNIDPFFAASVLSRGLIVEHDDQLWVASPLKKQRFRLTDGHCMEDEGHSVRSYSVRLEAGVVQIRA